MSRPVRILLQTTIPTTADDWSIERFSLLREHLASLEDEAGNSLCEVTARDREADGRGNDPVLSTLDDSDFDELWLFAVDAGDGLTKEDCAGITRFRQRGGGILATRDHQDLGSSLCTLGGIGRAHFFHTQNLPPDESMRRPDDTDTKSISWPNYHSGRNGDYQKIEPVEPLHELLRDSASASGVIEKFPAHPHEGAVGVPEGERDARVIATGYSAVTVDPSIWLWLSRARRMVMEPARTRRAESSFHHFVDYNGTRARAVELCRRSAGDGYEKEPRPRRHQGLLA